MEIKIKSEEGALLLMMYNTSEPNLIESDEHHPLSRTELYHHVDTYKDIVWAPGNVACHVNGIEKQNSNTKHMLFNINDLIEDISQGILLEPGDIIATGTPSGVGAGRDPQEFMWPGDVLESEIEGIGKIRNPIVAV